MQNEKDGFFKELINQILDCDNLTKSRLNTIKINLSKKYKFSSIVKNPQIIPYCDDKNREEILKKLNMKPTREMSGVTVLALFTKPHSCPHGKCIYCPGGPKSPY